MSDVTGAAPREVHRDPRAWLEANAGAVTHVARRVARSRGLHAEASQALESAVRARLAAQEIEPGMRSAMDVWREVGCPECTAKGTRGLVAAYEAFIVDDTTRAAMTAAATSFPTRCNAWPMSPPPCVNTGHGRPTW